MWASTSPPYSPKSPKESPNLTPDGTHFIRTVRDTNSDSELEQDPWLETYVGQCFRKTCARLQTEVDAQANEMMRLHSQLNELSCRYDAILEAFELIEQAYDPRTEVRTSMDLQVVADYLLSLTSARPTKFKSNLGAADGFDAYLLKYTSLKYRCQADLHEVGIDYYGIEGRRTFSKILLGDDPEYCGFRGNGRKRRPLGADPVSLRDQVLLCASARASGLSEWPVASFP